MNMDEVVPFLQVANMRRSLAFYREGLGFTMVRDWQVDGRVRWCRLEAGAAAIMLQERSPGADAEGRPGLSISLNFLCADALEYFRSLQRRGLDATEPFVGNGLWVTSVIDPDGFRLYFSSPADAAEESTLSGLGTRG